MPNNYMNDFLTFQQSVNYFTSYELPKAFSHPKIRYSFAGKNPTQRKVSLLKQTHGNNIEFIENFTKVNESIEGDGIFTTKSEQSVGVQTADCLPLLIYAQSNKDDSLICGAVHAGWRGLENGIILKAVDWLYQNEFSNIKIAIGPAISREAYEVDESFLETFKRSQTSKVDPNDLGLVFSKEKEMKWNFDLKKFALLQLKSIEFDPKKVFCSRECTFFNSHRWESYRRQGKLAGRNIASIEILGQ